MTRLTLELPEEVAAEAQRRAEGRGLSLSRFVADLVQREVHGGWPERFFEEVVGGWKGDPLVRPPQPPLER
jgi:hypothetical protein